MKAHEKVNLKKDECGVYQYNPDYYEYSFWRITDNLIEMLNEFNSHDEITKKAFCYKWARMYTKGINYETLKNYYSYGDSPIEKLFYQCFMYICETENIPLCLIPQYEIEIEGKNYRADFGVYSKKENKFLIECDGHEFHSSKQQIAYDNQRQRDLENAGYTLIRFSGSEIYKDEVKCVYEALKRMNIEIE